MAVGAIALSAVKVAGKLFGGIKKRIEKRKAKKAARFERAQSKLSARESELAAIQAKYFGGTVPVVGGIDNVPDNQAADQVAAFGLDLLRRKEQKGADVVDDKLVAVASNVGIKETAKQGVNMIMLGLGAIMLLLLIRKK